MTKQPFVVAIVAALLLGAPAHAQSAADLLQKGIHAQETVGDVDSAIQIFRQVAALPSANKTLAAQAQYQLVVCMLQKGDRSAARKELDLLARNFPDQPDLFARARKLVPAGDTLLPSPWGEIEGSQLNIKRDGVFTGDYLHYSVDPLPSRPGRPDNPQAVVLRWELTTANTVRSVQVEVDRDTMQPLGKPDLNSNDDLGDPSVTPLSGPAIDIQQSVFLVRRLPLAPGFKANLTTKPFTLASKVKSPVELAVTGIETVQTVAGKLSCYKVSMPAIQQTFWIGVDGARPLVKFQAGNVEAELVKVWTTNVLESMLAFAKAAGWTNFGSDNAMFAPKMGPGPVGQTTIVNPDDTNQNVAITLREIYTPKTEIAKALQKTMADRLKETGDIVRPESVETLEIGGQQGLRCVATSRAGQNAQNTVNYYVWIRTGSTAVEFTTNRPPWAFAVFRWRFDPVLATVKVP
jgi:hypothetical protein